MNKENVSDSLNPLVKQMVLKMIKSSSPLKCSTYGQKKMTWASVKRIELHSGQLGDLIVTGESEIYITLKLSCYKTARAHTVE